MKTRICHTLIILLMSAAHPAAAADGPEQAAQFWPQWRGPSGNGVAPHGDPPTTWNEQHNVRWKVEIPGSGQATPIVWGRHVFITTAIRRQAVGEQPPADSPEIDGPSRRTQDDTPSHMVQFAVMALDRATGQTVWRHTARRALPHAGHHRDATFASASPVTDGQHLIAHFGSNGVYGYDLDGKLLWQRDLGRMRTRRGFGEGSSPALHGNTVVINWDHEGDSFIVALDKTTGRELWKKGRDEVTSWSTPLIVEVGGRPQVIVNATHRVRGYDLESGTVLWECGGQTVNAIPTPVHASGLLIAMSGFRGNALYAIRLAQASGDVSGSPAIAWSHDEDTPYVPSPLLYGPQLYFLKGNKGILSCLHPDNGQPHFTRQRLDGVENVYASPVGAAGRVYIAGRDGTTLVLRHGPKFEILARNTLNEGADASPAIVGRELYLRGPKSLYCIAPQ